MKLTVNFIIKFFRILLCLPSSVFFNFYYLPINIAIKLPILLKAPKLSKLKGKVEICTDRIYFGMIRLGFDNTPIYYNTAGKVVWHNEGGTCRFYGKTHIKAWSAIEIHKDALLEFGANFTSGPMLRIICSKNICFSNDIMISWEVQVYDTDLHRTFDLSNKSLNELVKPIKIGNSNWIGARTIILKGTVTPNYCIVGANSLLNKKYDFSEYCLLAGNPATCKRDRILSIENSNFNMESILHL